MKKLGFKATLLITAISTMFLGGNLVGASSQDSYKEHFLSESNSKIATQAIGTIVSMSTSTNLTNGNVHSSGSTYCSKACADIRVVSYIYKNGTSVSYKPDKRVNATFAYASPKYVTYYSGSSYYGASDHYALNYYGEAAADRTVDSDL